MRAIVSVTFDDELVIHDIKVIQTQDRLFLAMPSRRMSSGEFCDIAHPTSAPLRRQLESAVLAHYLDAIAAEDSIY